MNLFGEVESIFDRASLIDRAASVVGKTERTSSF
jgi:hypothetical protein